MPRRERPRRRAPPAGEGEQKTPLIPRSVEEVFDVDRMLDSSSFRSDNTDRLRAWMREEKAAEERRERKARERRERRVSSRRPRTTPAPPRLA